MNKSILVLDVIVQVVPASLVVPGPVNHGGRRTLILLTRGVLSHDGVPCMNCLCAITTFPLTPPMPVVFFEPRTRRGNFELDCFCYLNYAYVHKTCHSVPPFPTFPKGIMVQGSPTPWLSMHRRFIKLYNANYC